MHSRLSDYGGQLTQADVWKSIALVLMTIDHIGWLFFPDELWWRVIGRLCVPIWCFLLGFHVAMLQQKARHPSLKNEGEHTPLYQRYGELGLAAIVAASVNHATLGILFPLPILFTLLAAYYILSQGWAQKLLRERPFEVLAAAAVLALPSVFISEYGTLGLLLCAAGYLSAHNKNYQVALFFTLSVGLFVMMQYANYDFSHLQMMALSVGLFIISFGLWCYVPAPSKLAITTASLRSFLMIAGRYTLVYYIAHKAVLQWLASVSG